MARAISTAFQSACLTLGLAAAAHATPSLIQNGDFEAGSFSSWTQSGNAVIADVPYFGLGSHGANGGYMVVFNAGDTPPNAVFSQSAAIYSLIRMAKGQPSSLRHARRHRPQ
jgi:hypothetical protein